MQVITKFKIAIIYMNLFLLGLQIFGYDTI